jgi:hypothetical protein
MTDQIVDSGDQNLPGVRPGALQRRLVAVMRLALTGVNQRLAE